MSEAITLKPIKDKIIVEPLGPEESGGGFMLTDNSQDVPERGKVLAVGPGLPGNPMEVKVGETVLYTKGVGEKMVWDDQELYIIHEENVLAIK
jgi:chaperonin GroES